MHEWMFKEDDEPQNRYVIFQDVRRILRKTSLERAEDEIEDLAYYFRNNPYFIEYEKENGEAGLKMLYRIIKFQVGILVHKQF